MHLQQTKRGSIQSGGPQYYFHDLSDPVKTYLRAKGAVSVALFTPYGATKSDYIAVSKDHKLDTQGNVVSGSVGHDRIQQGLSSGSIGEAIRRWYALPSGDFERIDVEIDILEDRFYVMPLKCKYAASNKAISVAKVERPLTFTLDYVSNFWRQQLQSLNKTSPEILSWSLDEICRVVKDHRPQTKLPHIQETDILRASGPLKHLGMTLGGYVGKGYDCITAFKFLKYPEYSVPVELKRTSQDFQYQQSKYGKDLLSRAIVLCATHTHKQVPRNIDVIELDAMCHYTKEVIS